MGHQQNRFAPAFELGKLVEALQAEALISHGQYFVHQQHVWVDVDRDREPKPHVHAGGVRLHRRVDEVFHLRELDDLVEAFGDLAPRQPQHDAVDEHVLSAGDLRMKTGAQLDECRHATVDAHGPSRRLGDTGDELEQRALPGTIPPDDAVGHALPDRGRHVVQGEERFLRPEILRQAAGEQRTLESGVSPGVPVTSVHLGDVVDLNRGHESVSTLPRRTSRGAGRTTSIRPERVLTPRRPGRATISSGRTVRRRKKSPGTRSRDAQRG